MDGACLSGWKWVVGICGLERVGYAETTGWGGSVGLLCLGHRRTGLTSRELPHDSGDRRRRRSSPPRRPIPPSSTTASDPCTLLHTLHRLLPRPFPHQLNPFIFLLDLRRIEQAARAAAAAAAPSRRPEFSSAVPAGHPHLRTPLPSVPPL